MVFIRADANEHIGSGHVMRCISVADALRKRGETIRFITSDHKSDQLISQYGFESIALGTCWNDMDSEINKLIRLIDGFSPKLLIVDSYRVTDHFFSELSKRTKIAYFDDINKAIWDIAFLINYNIDSGTHDYSGYIKAKTKLLLSPYYAPLRQEFRSLPKRAIHENVNDVLISTGGADTERLTERIISDIILERKEIKFHIVIGLMNPYLEEIQRIKPDNVVLHINEQHMSSVMSNCDIAISAAGSTLYELCACGTPTISYIVADNQTNAAKEFDRKGIIVNAGDCRNNTSFINDLKDRLLLLKNDCNKRSLLSAKMQDLIDGFGADRIADELIKEIQ